MEYELVLFYCVLPIQMLTICINYYVKFCVA